MKKFKSFIALIFVFSIFFFACSSGGGSKSTTSKSPAKAVEKSFDYYISKNYDKTVSTYVSGDYKKLTKEEIDKVKAMLPYATQEDDKNGGLKSIVIVNETIADDGNTAKVEYKKIYGNGDEETVTAPLVKIDGDWFMALIAN